MLPTLHPVLDAQPVRFEDALELEYLDGCNWKVTQDFFYDTDVPLVDRRVVIPAGFVTDFASIPRVLWTLIAPTTGILGSDYGKAAVVHDRLYRTKGLATRAQADRVLVEAMAFLKVRWVTRWIIYLGVRLGGFSSYKGGL
jgi:hypothetical protein